HMSQEQPEDKRTLPVLKVLHRNARFIQKTGCHEHEAMHPIEPEKLTAQPGNGEVLRNATRQADQAKAERILAGLAHGSLEEAYKQLQFCVEDDVDVHRVVLSWRAWETLDLTGKDQALTLLR